MRLDFKFHKKVLSCVFMNSALLLGAYEGFHSKNTGGYTWFNYCTLLPSVDYSLCPEKNLTLRLIIIIQCVNTDDCIFKCNHLIGVNMINDL